MKKLLLVLLVGIMLAILPSCTENQRAKQFGGTANVDLPKDKQLDMVTWKNDNLWLLTSDRPSNKQPKTYQFNEESSWGMLEGSYIINER